MGITSTSAALVSQPAARIVGSHGYRIDGDTAYLNADIEWAGFGSAPTSSSDWALQLWAHPVRPDSGKTPVLVAELPLQAARVEGHEPARVEGCGLATPPAGSDAYTMVLQLSTWSGNGDAVHDQVAFSLDEQFVQPSLRDGVYRLEGDRLVIEAASISNPRPADNLSGSLVLELWALERDYRGGAFAGRCIGSAPLGRLEGQQSWFDLSVSTDAAAWPSDAGSLSLMLREWTAAGYVTRDYVNLPSLRAAAPEAVAVVEEDVAAAALAEDEVPTPVAVEEAAKRAAAELFGAAPGEVKPADKKVRADEAPAKARAVVAAAELAPKAKKAKSSGVSINEASEDELAAVKGMPKAVVKHIVAKRPFLSLEGLLELKGMGPKLLDKLKRSLSL